MSIFKIGSFDMSPYIIQGRYTVNELEDYTEWEDALNITHRRVIRKRLEGSMAVKFVRVGDYERFIAAYNAAKTSNRTVNCSAFVNNRNEMQNNKNLFLDFEPTKNRNGSGRPLYDEFEIEIRER